MSRLIPLNELFELSYGNSLELISMEQCDRNSPDSINFVSRTERNNGISAFVRKVDNQKVNKGNTISVAVGGSVLSTFLQLEPYYTGFHVFVLTPIKKMSTVELLFYCECIKLNKYKYNYGRQANKTLKDLLLPNKVPSSFLNISSNTLSIPDNKPLLKNEITINTKKWGWFEIQDIFDIQKGKRLTKEDMIKGKTPFIGAIDNNNGCREYIGQMPIHSGNTITVNYNGSVAEAYYQPIPFWASDDVNVLYPKFKMNKYNALFITTIIKLEKYRFNFGRKWHVERMNTSKIKLPKSEVKGQPDWKFMEDYIKSLPYSSSL